MFSTMILPLFTINTNTVLSDVFALLFNSLQLFRNLMADYPCVIIFLTPFAQADTHTLNANSDGKGTLRDPS